VSDKKKASIIEAFFLGLFYCTTNNTTKGENNDFFGQPIFNQLINILDKQKITKCSKEQGSDRYCIRFDTF